MRAWIAGLVAVITALLAALRLERGRGKRDAREEAAADDNEVAWEVRRKVDGVLIDSSGDADGMLRETGGLRDDQRDS